MSSDDADRSFSSLPPAVTGASPVLLSKTETGGALWPAEAQESSVRDSITLPFVMLSGVRRK